MAKRKRFYISIINVFIAIVVIVLVGSAYLALAKATVTIPAEREEYESETTVQVSANPDDSSILGELLTQEFSASDIFPVGSTTEQVEKAGGVVTITNETGNNQPLIATTRLLTADGILFRITDGVTVPAGGSVQVFAEADQPGDDSIVDEGVRFTIPGLATALQSSIYAESSQPLNRDRQVAAEISQEDVTAAEEVLTGRIIEEALNTFNAQLPENASQLEAQHLTVKRVSIIGDPQIGEVASQTDITLTLEVTGVVVNHDDVLHRAEQKLKETLPEPERFIEIVPPSLTYEIATANSEEQTAELSTFVIAWIKAPGVPASVDVKQLTGKSKGDAISYLKSEGVENIEITIFPSWIPMMPLLSSHIEFDIE